MDDELDEFLAHFGVKGMKWGVRNASGISSRTNREARKDAKEFTAAKMFYGEGAGTRRKLINNTVAAKSKKDPRYKEAFDSHVSGTDMSKRASSARSERKRKDVVNTTKKTARGVGHVLRGNSQYASLAAVAVAGAGAVAWKNGGDKIVKKYGGMAVKTIKNEIDIAKTRKFLKDMGL